MTDTLNKPETARRALSILLVEDEAATLSALATLLSRRGHSVTTARDVHEALEQCGHDVVVTDLMLPSGTGLEVLAHMKSRGERPHAVVTTGTPSIDSCREAFKLGAVEFLQKPFRMEELVRAVEAAPVAQTSTRRDFRARVDGTPQAAQQLVADLAAWTLTQSIGAACRARIASAAAELIDNAWRHGHAAHIECSARFEGRDVLIVIADDGVGFDARLVHSDALANTATNGLARALALSEDCVVATAPGRGARATLRFTPWSGELADETVIDLSDSDWTTPETARRVLDAVAANDDAVAVHLTPALAVVVGRLLAHRGASGAQKALWS
jgi:CheY-like chemotaxis protein/anti-sigma regulatory factor (Ser/Thr protein kinase)